MGFDAKWGVLGAADIGANHQRDRIWIRGEATDPNRIGLQKSTNECFMESQGSNQLQVEQPRDSSEMADSERMGWQERSSERGTLVEQKGSGHLGNCGQTSGAGEMADSSKSRLQGKQWSKPQGNGMRFTNQGKDDANAERSGLEGWQDCGKQEVTWTRSGGAPIGTSEWWSVEPEVDRMAYGLAARMERIKAIGNGQVPLCAASAWRILK
jgi:DNA (cytosine-5)-methyltransferase 1